MMLSKFTLKIFIPMTITVMVCLPTYAQQRRTRHSRVQTLFGMENPIKRPAKIPKDVLEQLANREDVKRCIESADGNKSEIRTLFAASVIDVNNDGQPDLVVQAGENGCLNGANIGPFWVFTKVGQRLMPGYDPVFETSSLGITILNTSTNGYRDIDSGGATAVEYYRTVYKFDGQKYQPRLCTIEDLTTKKVVRVRCNPE